MRGFKFVWIILFLVIFCATNSTWAADVAKIGVIDLQKVLETSGPGKSIQAELKKEKDKMESDLKQKRR